MRESSPIKAQVVDLIMGDVPTPRKQHETLGRLVALQPPLTQRQLAAMGDLYAGTIGKLQALHAARSKVVALVAGHVPALALAHASVRLQQEAREEEAGLRAQRSASGPGGGGGQAEGCFDRETLILREEQRQQRHQQQHRQRGGLAIKETAEMLFFPAHVEELKEIYM